MAFIADSRNLGHLPLQDHDPSADVVSRCNVLAARIEGRKLDGRWEVQGHTEGSTAPQRTVGDVRCALFTAPVGDKRDMGTWTFALPSITQTASAVAPIRPEVVAQPVFDSDWANDDRLEVSASVHPDSPSVPAEHPGIVLAGMREDAQEPLFFPSQVPLIAANRAGSPTMSSLVHDVLAGNVLDRVHASPLHSAWNTIVLQKGCSFPEADAIAWQLGVDGLTDRPGFGLVAERAATSYRPKVGDIGKPADGPEEVKRPASTSKAPAPADYVLGYVSHLQSGPFMTGGSRKLLGRDDAGAPVYPVGISTRALYRDGGARDAPLDFEQLPYQLVNRYDHLSPVHLRFDGEPTHSYVCGADFGLWRWQAEVPYYKPKDDQPPPPPREDPPPTPPPPPPIPQPPRQDPPPFFPPREDGAFEPSGSGPGGAPLPGEPGGAPPLFVADNEQKRRRALGMARAWPTFSATARHAGGTVYRAFATATGEADLASGGKATRRAIHDQTCAPDVAAIVPVGKGTGRWCEWDYVERGRPVRQPRGEGGVALLPARYAAPEELARVLAGDFDPNVGGKSPETQASLFVPAGLASIDFASPTGGMVSGRGLVGGRTGAGIRAHQTSSGLTFQGLNGSGAEVANQTWALGTEGNLTHRRDAASATTGTLHQIETSGGAPVRLRGVSRRGTLASPSATQSGDELLAIESYGTSSIGADLEGAKIVFTQAGAISGSVLPSKIEFKAKGSGSAFITSYVDHEGFHGSIDAGDAYVARLLKHNGNLVGFYGVTAVTQPATPTTLADVIAALQALGLVA